MKQNPFELTMSDIMSKKVVTVSTGDTVSEAVKKMQIRGIGAVVVTDNEEIVIGIFSERDALFRVVAPGNDPEFTKIADVMTENPVTISSNISVFDAYGLAHKGKFRHIPIVDRGVLVGIVSARDINKTFYNEKDVLHKMKMKFAMITSHELKTPCAVINSCMYLLRDDMDKFDTDERDLLEKINRNVNNLMKITNSLAKLYGSTHPEAKIKMELTDINHVIENVIDDITPIVKGRQQRLSVKIDKNICSIMMDRKGVFEVFMSLLLNSVRFTPDRGEIEIRIIDDNKYVRVEIEDNGIGIPENKLNRIFESFYEVQDIMEHSSGSTGFKTAGLGIGLSIAKNTIEAHNGKIWAESKEGKYSRFIFTLPKR